MDLPYLEHTKKKQEEKRRKLRRLITLVLLLVVIAIFGGIFYLWKKEHLSVNSALKTDSASTRAAEQGKGAITPAPAGPFLGSIKYDEWVPSFFKNKLVYCDLNSKVHVKTDLDASKIITADRFSDDRARIQVKTKNNDSGYLYIDKSGKIVIPVNLKLEYCGPFSEGLASVEDRLSGKLGFINKSGKMAIPPQFHVSAFTSGNAVHKQEQLDATIFSDGLAPVYNANVNSPDKASCGYINHAGNYVIPASYQQGFPFCDQRARVLVKDNSKWKHRWGYIDKKGKYVLKPIYMKEEDFSEGMAAVLDYTGKWGYIDKDGAYKIPASFAGAGSFHQGIAAAATAGSRETANWGYIKKDGSWLLEPQFDNAEAFHDGVAYACNNCDDSAKIEEFSISAQGKAEKLTRSAQIDLHFPGLHGQEGK